MAADDDSLYRELRARIESLTSEKQSLLLEKQALASEWQSLVSQNQSLRSEIRDLKHQLAIALQMTYGRRSEKLNPAQLQLLFAQEDALTTPPAVIPPKYLHDAPDAEEPPVRKKGRGQAHPGRAPLPAHLPRERIEIHPEDLHCPCCQGQMKRLDEEITEELGRVPARFFVRQYVRVKYACPKCQDQIVRPELPQRVFEKGKAGADVIAEVAVSKFADHLPLHRQAAIYRREGVPLDKATMCDWLARGAELLAPIVQQMRRQLLLSPVVQSDDTPIQYLDPGSGRPAKRGYLWTYLSDEGDVLYDFKTSRSREGPSGFLAGYRGYLQADGYAGYNEVVATEGVTLVACWAHARRKFVEARDSDPHAAAAALLVIRALYEIEGRAKAEDSAPRRLRRCVRGKRPQHLPTSKDCFGPLPPTSCRKVRSPRRQGTLWTAGRRCAGTVRTAGWRSTTTRPNGRCGAWRSVVRTTCLPAARPAATGRRSTTR